VGRKKTEEGRRIASHKFNISDIITKSKTKRINKYDKFTKLYQGGTTRNSSKKQLHFQNQRLSRLNRELNNSEVRYSPELSIASGLNEKLEDPYWK